MTSSRVLRELSVSLDAQRALRHREQRERHLERQRLHDIQHLCRLLSSDDNNNTDDKLDDTDDKAVVSLADDLSDLSTIDGSSRDSSSQLESREEALSASNETLNALGLEESLLRAEISHLLRENDSDDNTDDNTDDDDTDLKEFRRIEREIKLTELNKGLEAVRGQIEAKKLSQRPRSEPPSAPLADTESLTTEESPLRDDAMDDNDDRRRQPDDERRQRRPLTLYMPNESEELDLEQHLRELGHELCHRDLHVTATTCAGYLFKLCQKSDNNWRKRFFVFDRKSKAFFYFRSRSQQLKQRAPQGGVAFDLIHDIYVDHTRSSDARHVFVVSTSARHYVLAHARPEVMRIWVDALVTGARGQDSDWNWIS